MPYCIRFEKQNMPKNWTRKRRGNKKRYHKSRTHRVSQGAAVSYIRDRGRIPNKGAPYKRAHTIFLISKEREKKHNKKV